MAKKSSTNAVKKLDKQISELKKKSTKKDDEKTPIISKTELKEGIAKAQKSSTSKGKKTSTKKKSTAKKTNNTKRTTSTNKTSTRKNSSKKKTNTKTSNNRKKTTPKKSTTPKKKIKDDIVVTPVKKDIKVDDDTSVRDDIVVSPVKSSDKKKEKKKEDKPLKEDVIVTPDSKRVKESKSRKIKDILTKKKESDDKESVEEKEVIGREELANEIEEDISNGKYIDKAKILLSKAFSKKKGIKRKKKGKNKYVIDLDATREYKNLERDLRSLYDKTNDIVDDIEKTQDLEKTVKTIEGLSVYDNNKTEKKYFLDYLNQRILNVFIVVLLGVFIIMTIVVIGFIIYVSTA